MQLLLWLLLLLLLPLLYATRTRRITSLREQSRPKTEKTKAATAKRAALRRYAVLCCAALSERNETLAQAHHRRGAERDRQSAKRARGQSGEHKVALSLLQPWGAACCCCCRYTCRQRSSASAAHSKRSSFSVLKDIHTHTHIDTRGCLRGTLTKALANCAALSRAVATLLLHRNRNSAFQQQQQQQRESEAEAEEERT